MLFGEGIFFNGLGERHVHVKRQRLAEEEFINELLTETKNRHACQSASRLRRFYVINFAPVSVGYQPDCMQHEPYDEA
jgi:hypothetical protein